MENIKDIQNPNILNGFTSLPVEEYDRLKSIEKELVDLKRNFDSKIQQQQEINNQHLVELMQDLRTQSDQSLCQDIALEKKELSKIKYEYESEHNKKMQELERALRHIEKMGLFNRIFNWDSVRTLLNK